MRAQPKTVLESIFGEGSDCVLVRRRVSLCIPVYLARLPRFRCVSASAWPVRSGWTFGERPTPGKPRTPCRRTHTRVAFAYVRVCRRYACICLCMSGRRSPRELADTREPGHRTWRRPAFTAQPRSHDACAQHSQALTRASPASQAWLKTLPVTPCHRWQARSCSRAVVAWLRP